MDDKGSKAELALEALVQAIPYVGGPLATLYFGHKQEKRFKRLESFYKEIKEEITRLGIKIPDISSHDPDELASIMEKIHDRIESEHLQIKREVYKMYYIKTLLNPIKSENYDERVLFLFTLERLTEIQMQIFLFIVSQSGPVIDKNINKNGTSPALVQGAIAQLKILGLIDSKLHGIVFGGSGNAMNEEISLSDFGRNFHNFCMR